MRQLRGDLANAGAPAGRPVPPGVAGEAHRLGLGELRARVTRWPHELPFLLVRMVSLVVVLILTAMAVGGASIEHDFGPAAAVGAVALAVYAGVFGGGPALRDARIRRGAGTRARG